MVRVHTAHRHPFMTSAESSAAAPTVEPSDWGALAACRDENPELFFPVGVRGPAKAQEQKALSVCARCPVIAQCRQEALATKDLHGVRGGMTEDQRRAALRAKSEATKKATQKTPAKKAAARKSPTRRVTETRLSA